MPVYIVTYDHPKGWRESDIIMDAANADAAIIEFSSWYTAEGEDVPANVEADVFSEPPTSLDDLARILNDWAASAREHLAGMDDAPRELWPGAPMAGGRLDMSSLPTFGGEEPSDTAEIWSWDADSYLMTGDADRPFVVIPREQWEDDSKFARAFLATLNNKLP